MKCASVPSAYRNCILRASVRTARNFSPARNVRSMTLPSDARRSFVRTNAPPLPGLTCWNSTTLKTVPSTSMWMPFLNWFVLITRREASAEVVASEPAELRAILEALPGFGEMKVKALGAVLAKRFGVEAAQDLVPWHPTLGDVDSPDALTEYQAAKRVHKAEWSKGQPARS